MTIINNNHYDQLRDYLLQLRNLPFEPGTPSVTQKKIAEQLNVDDSIVSKFLNKVNKRSPKMMNQFTVKYVNEFNSWPKGQTTIQRILTKVDACRFLCLHQHVQAIPYPPLVQPPQAVPRPPIVQAPQAIPCPPIVQRPQAIPYPPIVQAPQAIPYPPIVQRPQAVPRPPIVQAPVVNPIAPVVVPESASSHSLKQKAPIAISYRGHYSQKDAQGMLFDHMRLQTITNYPTTTLMPDSDEIANVVDRYFTSVIYSHPGALPYGRLNARGSKTPQIIKNSINSGLLLIPGRVRAIEDEPIRTRHEFKVIREALNRGQPLLGICAGSWRLWEVLYLWTRFPNRLNEDPCILFATCQDHATTVSVTDHCYNGGMLRLDSRVGINAVFNVQVHDVVIPQLSLLAKTMGRRDSYQIQVNSVHWKAVNPATTPFNIGITALAIESKTISIKARTGATMSPQANSVEAFETVVGAPLIGVQWHPEGYPSSTPHGQLLTYMARAGDAYEAKRKMMDQLVRGNRRG